MREVRPRHIVLFIASCLVLLGAICLVAEFNKPLLGSMRWPTLSDKLGLPKQPIVVETDSAALAELKEFPDSVDIPNVLDTVSAPVVTKKPVRKDTLRPVTPAKEALKAFKDALAEAGTKHVRVVHYGDSQIEEDRITATLRQHLQDEYGGRGAGLLPLVQTIPTRTVKQYITIDGERVSAKNGPVRHLIYGPKNQLRDTSLYGPLGQVAILDTAKGTNRVTMHIEPFGKLTSANYFSQVRIWKSDSIEVNSHSGNILHFPDSTTHCTLEFEGQGDVYGISLETPTGVHVDNIPMRGGSGYVFTQIDHGQLTRFFRETNTRLIILQFGGNVMPWAETEERVKGYAYSMRKQVRYLRSCAPDASILFIGPSDMTTVVDGEKTTYPLLPLMDEQLARMAASEGIAYWSLYKSMGGWNSMITWQEKGLAASDGVHFMQAGARKAGEMLWKWLEKQLKSEN